MPHRPGVTDISGQLLADGITGAVTAFNDQREKLQLTEKEVAHLKGSVGFAAQKGLITPEELAEFETGNLSKKRELAVKAGMAYADLQKEQQFRLTEEEMKGIQGRHDSDLRLRAEDLQQRGKLEGQRIQLNQEELDAMKEYRGQQANTAAMAAAAKARAEANKGKMTIVKGPKAGEVGMVNGQVVRPPTPPAESKAAPDWAKEAVANDPTLFWNGTKLAFKQPTLGEVPGAPPRPAGTPASAAPLPSKLSPADQAAMQWAEANPRDPRAAAIRKRLGL